MADEGDAPTPSEVAAYIADVAGQLAALAAAEGFQQTADLLSGAKLSALADQRAHGNDDAGDTH